METDDAIAGIRASIAEGDEASAGPRIRAIAVDHPDEPMTLLTCASLALTINDEDCFQFVLSQISSNVPADSGTACALASGLLALDVPKDALHVLEGAGSDDTVLFFRASALHALMRDAEALEAISASSEDSRRVAVLRSRILGGLKRYDEAIALIGTEPEEYDLAREYVQLLIRSGRTKDAQKFVRARAKRPGPDGFALMGQYQWTMGNVSAAGMYCGKALKLDPDHIGALEYFGYALAYKGAVKEAKITAGAINEKAPGNPAAFRIIILCRGRRDLTCGTGRSSCACRRGSGRRPSRTFS